MDRLSTIVQNTATSVVGREMKFVCFFLGKQVSTLKDSRQYVQGVSWDPLGKVVVTLSSDRYAHLENSLGLLVYFLYYCCNMVPEVGHAKCFGYLVSFLLAVYILMIHSTVLL